MGAIYFLGLVLFIIRLNFGISGLPKGTNILGTFLSFYFVKHYGFFPWYPLIDWGQPVGGFTGPTILVPLIYFLPISILIRVLEASLLFVSGFTTFYVLRKTKFTALSSIVGSTYYLLMTETSQFFDGHFALMVTYALFPLFLYYLYRSIEDNRIWYSVLTGFTFYLIFSLGALDGTYTIFVGTIPIFLFLIVKRIKRKRYSIKDWYKLSLSPILFLLLSLTWLIPYVYGIRPQFTTNIIVNVLPFSQTGGIAPLYAFSGFIADISYTLYYLHSFTYSFVTGIWYGLFLVLPFMFLLFILRKKIRRSAALVLIYSFFFAIVATGDTVPIFSTLNYLLYSYFPLFNLNPSLFRWDFLTIAGYTFLLSSVLDTLIPNNAATCTIPKPSKNSKRKQNLKKPMVEKTLKVKLYGYVTIAVILIVVFSQNSEMLSSPPTTFTFPTSHVDGYLYLQNMTGGYVMEAPFGSIYSRTPWGGVSQSSEFMSPYFDGKDTIMFEGGTPYSLAMDEFLGYGETYGLTNNISKFLLSDNVQYIAVTNYKNWSHPSAPFIGPQNSVYGIYQQNNLGTPIFQSGNQTVFDLGSTLGNLYFTNTYYVYMGNDTLLYEISDLPAYNYTNGLVSGINMSNNELQSLIEYSSGLFVSLNSVKEYNSALDLASLYKIPIYLVGVPIDTINGSLNTTPYEDAWNASNGVTYNVSSQGVVLSLNSSLPPTLIKDYNNETVSVRTKLPFSSSLAISSAGTVESFGNYGILKNVTEFNKTLYNEISAGMDTQESFLGNDTLSLQDKSNGYALLWNFTADSSTYQYVYVPTIGFGNSSGLSFEVNTTGPLLFTASYVNDGHFYQSSIPEQINTSSGTSTFYVNYKSLKSISSFNITSESTPTLYFGLEHTGNLHSLTLSNFSLYSTLKSGSNSFHNYALSSQLQAMSGETSLTMTGNTSINFFVLGFSNNSNEQVPVFQSINGSNANQTISVTHEFASSGLLIFTQTYSAYWDLSSNSSNEVIHLPVNIGLNGWLVNSNNSGRISIFYRGYPLVKYTIIIEVFSLIAFATCILLTSESSKETLKGILKRNR